MRIGSAMWFDFAHHELVAWFDPEWLTTEGLTIMSDSTELVEVLSNDFQMRNGTAGCGMRK